MITSKKASVETIKKITGLIIFIFLATGLTIKNFHGIPLIISIASILTFPFLVNIPGKLSRDDIYFFATLISFYALHQIIDYIHDSSIHSRQIRFFAAVMACYLIIKLKPKVQYYWLGVATGGVICAAWALYATYYLGMARVETYRFNAIHFGAGSISLSYISLAGFIWANTLNSKKKFWLTLFTLGVAGGILSAILSGSRGIWLSIIPVLPLAIYSILSNSISNKKNTTIITILILIILLYTTLFTDLIQIIENRFLIAIKQAQTYIENDITDTSVGFRFEMWKVSWLAFLEAPLIGLGREGYYDFQEQLIAKGIVSENIAKFHTAHSGYFDTLGKYGIAGITLFLSLHFLMIYCFIKKALVEDLQIKSLALGAIFVIVAYLIFNLTDIYLYRSKTIMIFLFPLTFAWAFISIREKELASND